MAERRILFADADPKALKDFCRAMGPDWQVTGVEGGMAALSELKLHPCSVVVASIDLPEGGGVELLNHVRVAYPETVRFLTAPYEMAEEIERAAYGHSLLPKPFDHSTLKSAVEHPITAEDLIIDAGMREVIGRVHLFPTIPSLYVEVTKALDNPAVTTNEIGAIVAKDLAMTTKLLQVLNSAYFSLPRPITEPAEAIGILGFETIKSLILSLKLMGQYSKIKPVYFSIDSVWRHSTNVAPLAKQFILLESNDPVMGASAYTAGLMHDLGKVILAANFDKKYSEAHAIARKEQRPLCDVEKEVLGANHGEIGAYLLSLWRMPRDIVEAAALHHHPSRVAHHFLTPLTAVHVANVLAYENNPGNDGLVDPSLDIAYLEKLGLANRLPEWRDALGNPGASRERTPSRPAPKPTPKPMAQPAPTPVTPIVPPLPVRGRTGKRVFYAALGLCAIVSLMWYMESPRPEPVSILPQVAPPAPIAAIPRQKSSPPALTPAPKSPASAISVPRLVLPAQIAAPAPSPAEAVVPEPSIPSSDAAAAFDGLTLTGIFFSASSPSAIINGKLVRVNQSVGGCRLVEVAPKSVTLEYQNQRKTILFE